MQVLVLSSSFTFYRVENGIKIPQVIDNNNGFLDTLKKYLTKRDCMVVISGNPDKKRTGDPLDVTRKGFELSGIGFKEYIYVDSRNQDEIAKYIKKADCIDLCGGHLPTCNEFINRLGLKELLKNFNGVIIGASGGAMNMASNVYCKPENEGEVIDKTFKRCLKGLGLTNINIVPHYNVIKEKMLDGVSIVADILIPDSITRPLILLNDGSYIVKQGNVATIYGECYKLHKCNMERLCSDGQTIKIYE